MAATEGEQYRVFSGDDPGTDARGPTERLSLKKELTLINGLGIIVGTIIGSGIFMSPTDVLGMTHSVGLSLLVWLGAGILAIGGGLCYIELGTSIPKSGAEYAYLMEAFGPIPAYLFAWTYVWIIQPAGNAIQAITFAQYTVKPVFFECEPPEEALKLMAITVLVLTTALNCWSVKWTSRVIDLFTYGKLICIFILIVIGFIHLGKGHTENLQDAFKGSTTNPGDIAFAFYVGGWAYGGWSHLNYITEEMKKPTRDMPRAIAGGVCLVIVCYLLVNVSYLAVLGAEGVLTSEAVAVSMGHAYLGPMAWIIPFFVAVSVFGAFIGASLISSRLTFAAAREGHLPQLLAMIQVQRYTPMPSLLFSTVLSVIFLIPEASTFQTMVGFLAFAAWLGFGCTFAALLWLRWKRPEMHRPYKVWLFVPVLMLGSSAYLTIAPIMSQPMGSLYALIIILSGLPFYFLFVSQNRAPEWLSRAIGILIIDWPITATSEKLGANQNRKGAWDRLEGQDSSEDEHNRCITAVERRTWL